MKQTYPKNHHYVPQFLLKNFCFGKKKYVWVYDKKTDKEFNSNIRNIASEIKFYEMKGKDFFKIVLEAREKMLVDVPEEIRELIEKGEFKISMEEGFCALEGNSKRIIEKILESGNLFNLIQDEKIALALFLAVQMVRTKTYIDMVKYTNEMLRNEMMTRGFSEEQAIKAAGMDDAGLKYFHMRQIMDAERFVPLFLNKIWVLFKSPQGLSFYIGDNPIVLQNINQNKFRGNLGLAVRGIEIYMPIAKNYVLALFCPSYGEMVTDVENKMKMLPEYQPSIGKEYVYQMLEGIKSGSSVELREESVINLNYLQTMFSSRFVYSNRQDFDLVKDMISENGKYRGPLRPVVA